MAKTLPLDDIGALMAALDHAHPGPGPEAMGPIHREGEVSPGDSSLNNGAMEGGGRVLRVQLGYNPNSSSLGTSVVMLLWGMGTAMVLLQAVGAALLAQGPKGLLPSGSNSPDEESK